MKKDTIQIIMTIVLFVALILLLVNMATRKKPRKSSVNKSTVSAAIPNAQNSEKQGNFVRLEEESKSIEFRRDPFSKKTMEGVSTATPNLILSGIAWDKNNPTAIINDKIVKIGTDIEGNSVVDIKENKVILNDGKHNFELILY